MNKYNRAGHIARGLLFGIGGLAFAALLALIMGWVLMLLWNWLMPDIFGLPLIGYWQAWGLILLSHLLFKGGAGHGRHPRFRPASVRGEGRGHGPRGGRYRGHSNEDFDAFKNEFKQRMKARWHESETAGTGEDEPRAGNKPGDWD